MPAGAYFHCARARQERPIVKSQTTVLLVLCTIALCIPLASAADTWQPWENNPEHITAMKAFVAYTGEKDKATMDGAVTYFSTINNGATDLSAAEQQFLATVASVQSMNTNTSIDQALAQMKSEITAFRTDVSSDLKTYNGSASALHTAVNASVTADQPTIQNLYTAWWSARETSRLDEFTYNDGYRHNALANLTTKGADTSAAQAVLTQIDGLQPALKAALDNKDEKALESVNEQLGTLCRQFWSDLSSAAWQTRETTRLAEFDNRTAQMQGQLANLTAKGIDVSSAQAILNQIVAERPALQTAFQDKDETALKTVDSQLTALYQQFRAALQQIRQTARPAMTARNQTRYAGRAGTGAQPSPSMTPAGATALPGANTT